MSRRVVIHNYLAPRRARDKDFEFAVTGWRNHRLEVSRALKATNPAAAKAEALRIKSENGLDQVRVTNEITGEVVYNDIHGR